jgi:hypothetical protein
VLQHLADDARFHETPFFAESVAAMTSLIRPVLPGESGVRTGFLGHLLLELLLDAALVAEDPARLDEYYRLLDSADPGRVQEAVNRFAPRPTARLAEFIGLFRRTRILWDYLEDATLMVRLNQVMRRVGLEPLPDALGEVVPAARRLVSGRRELLLQGIPARRCEMPVGASRPPAFAPLPITTDP